MSLVFLIITAVRHERIMFGVMKSHKVAIYLCRSIRKTAVMVVVFAVFPVFVVFEECGENPGCHHGILEKVISGGVDQ
jgi:hypothetical protein